MEIRYSKAAVKAISGMDKTTKERIKAGILGLTQSRLGAISNPCKVLTMAGSGCG